MDRGRRPAGGAPRPGTEPAGLCLTTVAVVAALIIAGVTAGARAAQDPGTTPPGSRPGQRPPMAGRAMPGGAAAREGMKLLGRAAAACRAVPFQGVEILDWHGPAGPGTSVVNVWHARGARPLTRAALQVPDWPGGTHHIAAPGEAGGGQVVDGDGMLSMSPRLVGLLGTNYRLAAGGWGSVAGRPARLVVAIRPGGGLAARFWLDKVTYLPLRRQMFDTSGRVISDVTFTRLRLGPAAVARLPGPAARPWNDTLAAAQLTRLRGQGWPLPGPLPGHLALLGASEDPTPAGPVIDLDYSDGLSLVSVFVQRGHLPPALRGWAEVALRGHRVYTDDADGHNVAWSARGFVYTVIAQAPPQTLARVVAALPHDSPPGILGRIRQGLRRFASWLRF